MNDLQQALREVVAAGPPGYRPPADPYALVASRIRARRRRRVAGLSCVAALLTGATVVTATVAGSGNRTQQLAPASSASPRAVNLEPGMPPGYVIADAGAYVVYATTTAWTDICLYAPNLGRLYVCFDAPPSVDWVPASRSGGSASPPTALLGVTTPAAMQVRVELRDGQRVTARTVTAPTTDEVRFFVARLPEAGEVAGVQALAADGHSLGPALTSPPPQPLHTGCGSDERGSWCFATPVPEASQPDTDSRAGG